MLTTKNPWSMAQRQIIAEIVNEALELTLEAQMIVGCVVEGDRCVVIWSYNDKRHSFWFDVQWFRERVQAIKTREVQVECESRGLNCVGNGTTFLIYKSDRNLGLIEYNSGWYCIIGGQKVFAPTLADAIFSLWMLAI